MISDPQYQIGLTLATLEPITWYGVPYPDKHGYNEFGVVRQCSNMILKGFGWPSSTWEWRSLSQAQLYGLLDLFDADTDMSKQLYVRTYKAVGWESEAATFLCLINRPVDENGRTIQPQTASYWTNITIAFTHLEEL